MIRLKELRKEKKMSQQELAAIIGVTQAALSGWENEKYEIDNASIFKLADIFGVSVDYLLGRESDMPAASSGVMIPVLGRVQAGVPISAVEEILGYEEISKAAASQGEHFALRVQGDSMSPRICDGDIVIVRQQSYADTGDIVVALVNGDDATVKKLKKTDKGLYLMPLNPSYEPIFYDNEDIAALPVAILGKVVELRAEM